MYIYLDFWNCYSILSFLILKKKKKTIQVNVMINYLFSALARSVGQSLAVTLTSKSTCSPMLTSGHSFGFKFGILVQFGERGL